MRSSGYKKDKLQEKILNDLNSFLRFSVDDPRLSFVSITRVQLTDDYSRAEVYWDTFSEEKKEQASKAIQSVKGKLRSQLAKVLKIRAVPELVFKYDSQYESELKITKLLSGEDYESQD